MLNLFRKNVTLLKKNKINCIPCNVKREKYFYISSNNEKNNNNEKISLNQKEHASYLI